MNDDIRSYIATWIKTRGQDIIVGAAKTVPPLPRPVVVGQPSRVAPPPPIHRPVPASMPVVTSVEPNGADVDKGKFELIEVLVAEIQPYEGQPRQEFTEADLAEIRNSIAQEGQTQAIVVTPIDGVPGKRWGLVDGERRYRGAVAANVKTLLAITRKYANDGERFWSSFLMNWNRRGHTSLESSRAIERAIAEGKSVEEICRATGRSNCWVYQHHQLQKLEIGLQKYLLISTPKAERMPLIIAQTLSRIPDKAEQVRIWDKVRGEKSRSLMKIRVDELAQPFLVALPRRGRRPKPSDNGRKIMRIVRTMEGDIAFLSRASEADLRAFLSLLPKDSSKERFVEGMGKAAVAWNSLAGTLGKLD